MLYFCVCVLACVYWRVILACVYWLYLHNGRECYYIFWPLQAEIEAARAGGAAYEKLLLETGKEIKVPIGEEVVTDESTGQQYQIVWAQDEEGKLQILSHTPMVKRPSQSSDDVASGSTTRA